MWSIDKVNVFVMNMDSRKDRWNALVKQPEFQNIPNLKRFSSINGKALDINTDPRIGVKARYNIKHHTRRSHDMLDSLGGVGCALTHIALWQKLVESDQNVFLIMEDDIVIPEGSWQKVVKLFHKYPYLANTKNWDFWSLGNHLCDPKPMDPTKKMRYKTRKSTDKWIECKEFFGLNAYFLTKEGAKKLLKEVFPIIQHIDWFISYYAQTQPFKIIFNPYVSFKQRGLKSDITPKQCVICDIPTNAVKTHHIIPKDNVTLKDIASVTHDYIHQP
jgi:GR25 family glycosyltransferase involved in LPS biosynthesis